MPKTSYNAKKTPARDVQGGNFNHVGILRPLGVIITTAKPVGEATIIALYNSDSNVQYVVSGNASMAAPTSGLDGVAIPPNSYIFIITT